MKQTFMILTALILNAGSASATIGGTKSAAGGLAQSSSQHGDRNIAQTKVQPCDRLVQVGILEKTDAGPGTAARTPYKKGARQ